VTAEFTRGDKVPELEVVDYASFVRERGSRGLASGDLVLVSHGQIAHSSIPATGRNAIVEIALVGARMSELGDGAFQRAFRFVDERIGLIHRRLGLRPRNGRSERAGREDDGEPRSRAYRRGSRSPRAGDQLPRRRRQLGRRDRVEIHERRRRVRRDQRRDLSPPFDAYYYADDDPLLRLVVGSYREVRGTDPPLLALGSTTYAKAAPNLVGYGTDRSRRGRPLLPHPERAAAESPH
jgi:acetylornithine deacetylase/succinyl-diaminopimelate desuccinylase-like protein